MLIRTKVKEELKRTKREEVLNIQVLAIRSLPHSSSSLKCAKGKAYIVKIQFTQIIIQDIDTTRTSTIEFLRRSRGCWRAKVQTRPQATLIDPVCIEESKEDEAKEHHFVEA